MNKLVLILLLIAFVAKPCAAADVSIRVANQSGEPVSHVRISSPTIKRNYFTSSSGQATIRNVEGLTIQLRLKHIGYKTIDTMLSLASGSSFSFTLADTAICSEGVVVTATREARAVDELPIPADILSAKEIAAQGNKTLTEALTDQAGLQVVGVVGRGAGIQLQGLDPEYTLILIDGNPTIGRTSGVVNLDRFVTQNIEKIEIVKGPSSSQYGSHALAGVINIVTKKPSEGLKGSLGAKYSSFNTANLDGSLLWAAPNDKYSFSLFGSAARTDGFKQVFGPGRIQEQPENSAYTTTMDFSWRPAKSTEIAAGLRYNISNYDYYFTDADSRNVLESGTIWDANASLAFRHKFSSLARIEAKAYFAKYKSFYEDTERQTGAFLSDYSFIESIARGEIIGSTTLLASHNMTVGGGSSVEGVESASIDGGKKTSNVAYAYVQDDWFPFTHFNIIASLRYDAHQDFADNLSPKLAFACNPWEWFTFRGSVGSGFKAPTSEQLYLDWSNPTSNYSVFGVVNIRSAIAQLEKRGELVPGSVDFSAVKMLTPERSVSVDFGWSLRYESVFEMRANFFANKINDMILYQPIAQKISGGNVWTYFNLNSAFTRGVEVKFKLSPPSERLGLPNWLRLALDVSYQYLTSGDEAKLDSIRAGRVGYVDARGNYHRTTESEYGGLVGRAEHSGLCRLSAEIPDQEITFSLRANFRGKYGFFDYNGNGVIDENKEYAPGYVLMNATLNKRFAWGLAASVGVDNLLDKTDYRMMAMNPGRTIFVGMKYDF